MYVRTVHFKLMFFPQLYIQRDIRGYTPVSGDLAYPEKLLVTASINRDKENPLSDNDSVFDQDSSGLEVRMYVLYSSLKNF